MTGRAWRSLSAVIGLAAIVVLIDQITKIWAQNELAGKPSIEVFGDLLQFTYALNPGAAFSLGGDYTWVFTIAATAVSIAVIIFAVRVRSAWWLLALGLLLGGAVGNLVDRATQPPGFGVGYVRDFIELPNWPIFNVADMAVVAAAGTIVVLSLIGISATESAVSGEDKDEEKAAAAGTSDA
jgi:signal peptidase II